MSFRIRQLQAQDLPAVMRLQAEAYPELAESAAAIRSRLHEAPAWCWVAEGSEGLAAYLLTHPWPHPAPPEWNAPLPRLPEQGTRFYIHDLALGSAARGHGLAKALIRHALHQAGQAGFREVHLVAVPDSAGFWQQQGFHPLQTLDDTLRATLASYGDDACLLWRQL